MSGGILNKEAGAGLAGRHLGHESLLINWRLRCWNRIQYRLFNQELGMPIHMTKQKGQPQLVGLFANA